MHREKDKSKLKYIKFFSVFLAILLIIGFIYFIIKLFNNRTINSSTKRTNYSFSSLSCSINDSQQSFFDLSETVNNKQEIKIAFKDDYISTIMYTLDANYNYKKIAKEKEAKFYADYDHFMADHGLSIEKLSTIFTSSDLKVKIKLYAEKENLNSMTAKLFLLDSANGEYSSKVLQKYYEEKGFTCNYKN